MVLVFAAALAIAVPQAGAFEGLEFKSPGASEDLRDDLRQASLLLAARRDKVSDPQDLFSAAQAEYARLLAALYSHGHYSAVIRVLIDGREAATIAPLDAPSRIGKIEVVVEPGPAFRFSRAELAPLPARTPLPAEFAIGQVAGSGTIREAVTAGIDRWRAVGHAKAAVAGQDLTADHGRAQLSASVRLDPGPKLRFGKLILSGQERMREQRIRKIAGLPVGEVFDPRQLARAAERLRRTGIFRSVSLTEAETITAPDLLEISAVVVEEKPRRYSVGAEIASLDGLTLTGSWLHRNLLGGGERLEIKGEITNIAAQASGVDYALGVTLDRPATLTPDTTGTFHFDLGHLDEQDYNANFSSVGLRFSHYFSEQLSARVGLEYEYVEGRDLAGGFLYRNLSFPVGAIWDRRNSKTDASRGFYLEAEAKPFLGFGSTDSGVRLTFDGRAYRGLGRDKRLVLAARFQGGAILGSGLLRTPRDFLFYSGGGGTVRGQPYQSLGVSILRGAITDFDIGGTHYLATSAELRFRVTEKIGVVGFVDAGQVSMDGFSGAFADWHAGAGLGLRYATGFGPIRLDVAAPIAGNTGDGVQVYVGIGQSF